MFGYIEWGSCSQTRRSAAVERESSLTCYFHRVQICRRERTPKMLLRHRAANAAKWLSRMGVSRAVFPEQFSFLDVFSRRGIFPIDLLPLYRAIAAKLADSVMKSRGLSNRTAVLALYGRKMSSELERAVTELCIHNRYVMLDAPDPEGKLCRRLRREYGVSLVLTENADQLMSADLLILFDSREDLMEESVEKILPLYPGAELPVPVLCLPGQKIPDDCCRPQFFAALYELGVIRPGQLEVSACAFPEKNGDSGLA